jgi:dipeptidyl aminopeptidase/acylaminoacyl peptidase
VTTGHLVYAVGAVLYAVRFDLDRLEPDGGPIPVAEGLRRSPTAGLGTGTANYDFADTGTLVYVQSPGVETGGTLVWVDRRSREKPLGLPVRTYCTPRVSPDGTRVAFSIIDGNSQDVWVSDLSRPGTLSKVTDDPAPDQAVLWSPDSQRLVFMSVRDGSRPGIFSAAADGTGEVERLLVADSPEVSGLLAPEGWSADRTMLAFTYLPGLNLGLLSLEGDRAWKPLLATDAAEDALAISPDGQWIAYESDRTSQYEVYIERFPAMGNRQPISADGGRHPLWSPDQKELFYRRPTDGAMMVASLEPASARVVGTPRAVFEGRSYPLGSQGCGAPRQYDLSPDGQRFLMIRGSDGAPAAPRIAIVQNWFEELKRLVPR